MEGVCSIDSQPSDEEPQAPDLHGSRWQGGVGVSERRAWAQLTVTLTSEAGQLGVTLSSPISRAWLRPQGEEPGRGAKEARLHHRLRMLCLIGIPYLRSPSPDPSQQGHAKQILILHLNWKFSTTTW